MLTPLRLVDQFNELEHAQPADWADLRFRLGVADESRTERAAALLAPANAGRHGSVIRFSVDRRGRGIAPEAARRLLRRLDAEGITGDLELVATESAPPGELRKKETLREQWERQLALLPADWSDLWAEVLLDSTDYVERAALLLSPLNPAAGGAAAAALRFRSARRFGYGAAPEVARRCFERCDNDGITGRMSIVRVMSDTDPVSTQGPVLIRGGRVE